MKNRDNVLQKTIETVKCKYLIENVFKMAAIVL